MSSHQRPAPGEMAPDFELPDGAGKPVRLSSYRGQRTVVLYFYPKDDSPGCTAEACSFRDAYEEFSDAGAEIIGVSVDSGTSHEAFAAKHRLPFVLLSDTKNEVRQLYGIRLTLGLIPGRTTFVIDRTGVVRLAFDSQIRAREHVARALQLVKTLEAKAAPAKV